MFKYPYVLCKVPKQFVIIFIIFFIIIIFVQS